MIRYSKIILGHYSHCKFFDWEFHEKRVFQRVTSVQTLQTSNFNVIDEYHAINFTLHTITDLHPQLTNNIYMIAFQRGDCYLHLQMSKIASKIENEIKNTRGTLYLELQRRFAASASLCGTTAA